MTEDQEIAEIKRRAGIQPINESLLISGVVTMLVALAARGLLGKLKQKMMAKKKASSDKQDTETTKRTLQAAWQVIDELQQIKNAGGSIGDKYVYEQLIRIAKQNNVEPLYLARSLDFGYQEELSVAPFSSIYDQNKSRSPFILKK